LVARASKVWRVSRHLNGGGENGEEWGGWEMNVGRGLFRAWILVSILWVLGAGVIAYTIVAPEKLRGNYQPTVVMKRGTTQEQVEKIDFSKPFYDVGVSPSQSHLTIQFSVDTSSPEAQS